MASIQTGIRLNDKFSSVLSGIVSKTNMATNAMEGLNRSLSTNVNTSSLVTARQELNNADISAQRLNRDMQNIGRSVSADTMEQRKFHQSLVTSTAQANTLFSKVKGLVSAYIGIQAVRKGIKFVGNSIAATDIQIQAETKLTEIMRTRMAANNDVIDSIKRLAAEQQSIGVVGDEIQMAGAQQLSTFLSSAESLRTLIPAMNNLAVQQNGVNATSENMVSIGNMMGKVMQGQTSALKRVGVTFDEAQEKILKYGTEQERAVTLAQVITQNVGRMNETIANTPQGQIQQMKNTWGDIREEIGAQLYPAVMGFFRVLQSNMPIAQSAMSGFAAVLSIIINLVSGLIRGVSGVGEFISEHWGFFEPIIWGIVGALGVYVALMALAKTISVLSAVAGAAAWFVLTGATIIATLAQHGFNAALSACPLMWIIILIGILIAVIVALANHFSGAGHIAQSAFGAICGAAAVCAAVLWNTVIGVINAIIQAVWSVFVEPFISIIEWVLNVANGGFDGFGGAVANLIGQIISWFLSLGKVVTKIIDAIFGTDWTSGLSSLQDKVLAWGKNDNAITLDRKAPAITKRLNYEATYKAGAKFGDGVTNKVKDYFSGDKKDKSTDKYEDMLKKLDSQKNSGLNKAADKVNANSAKTADNTSKIADSVAITSEDLKYIRDMAERDYINRFTTAKITVNQTNHNNIKNDMDLDGVTEHLRTTMEKQMIAAAEGVH